MQVCRKSGQSEPADTGDGYFFISPILFIFMFCHNWLNDVIVLQCRSQWTQFYFCPIWSTLVNASSFKCAVNILDCGSTSWEVERVAARNSSGGFHTDTEQECFIFSTCPVCKKQILFSLNWTEVKSKRLIMLMVSFSVHHVVIMADWEFGWSRFCLDGFFTLTQWISCNNTEVLQSVTWNLCCRQPGGAGCYNPYFRPETFFWWFQCLCEDC